MKNNLKLQTRRVNGKTEYRILNASHQVVAQGVLKKNASRVSSKRGKIRMNSSRKEDLLEQLRDYADSEKRLSDQAFVNEMPTDLSMFVEEQLMNDMVALVDQAGYEMDYSTQMGRGIVKLYDEATGEKCGECDYEEETALLRSMLLEGRSYEDIVRDIAEGYIDIARDNDMSEDEDEDEDDYSRYRRYGYRTY